MNTASPVRSGPLKGLAGLLPPVGLACLLLAAGACQQGTDISPPPPGEDRPPPGPPFFADVTRQSGISHCYRNGEEAGHFAILESLGGGVALIDYDGDGLLDIFVTGGGYFDKTEAEFEKASPDHHRPGKVKDGTAPNILGHPCKLYKNLGNFKFKDVTAEVFPQQPGLYTHGAAVADYDRDGWPDLLVTGYGGVVLYRNTPVDPKDPSKGRRFADVTREVGLSGPKAGRLGQHFWATSAAWADLDGDGFPDLYVCQYANWSWKHNPKCRGYSAGIDRDVCPPKNFIAMPHALYRNDGKGRFIDVTKSAGIRMDYKDDEHGKGLGVVIADVNGDGKPDVFVANDTVDNFLYLNRSKPGALKFDEVGLERGVARDSRGLANGNMGVTVGDCDGSGRPSVFITTYEGELFALFKNVERDRRAMFMYASQSAGIGAIGTLNVGFGTLFTDVDNDGWLDLPIANGHVIRHPVGAKLRQLPVLLLNKGNGRFADWTSRGGPYFAEGHRGRGMAVGDLDNDGKPDLVISNVNEPVAVLRNVAPTKNHWLGVELLTKDHRDLVGAKLTLEVEGRKITRFVTGGGSYLSAHDPARRFGLGQANKVGRLTVAWPSGEPAQQHWDGLAIDRYHRLVQGEAAQPSRRGSGKP